MPRVNMTQDDLLRSKLLTPGWYTVFVKDLEEKTAGTDGSALYVYHLRVEENVKGDKSIAGVPLRFQISEKAIGMAMPILAACGWKATAGSVELKDCLNKHIQAFVQRGEYNGRPQNEIVDFRPAPSAPTS
ncbi:MAG: hypothetical protein WD512_02585 [Candidatus Paceibacterota bacterium]